MNVYAFDVDETLQASGGPIHSDQLWALRGDGHIVGLCGNWAVFVRAVPEWHEFVSFVGPMLMVKADFLQQIKRYVPADEYIMVGNIAGVTGASDDEGAARAAGWRFISEREFATGKR